MKRRITAKSRPTTDDRPIVEDRTYENSRPAFHEQESKDGHFAGEGQARKKQRLDDRVVEQQSAIVGSVGRIWPAAPTLASCSSTELYGRKFDTSVTGMAFADRRFSPVLADVERPKRKDEKDDCSIQGWYELASTTERSEKVANVDPIEEAGCKETQSFSSGSWLKRDAGAPSGHLHQRELVSGPQCKVARFSIHVEAQHFAIDDDSEEGETAQDLPVGDCVDKGKDTKPKRYRVRSKNQSWRLFDGRKGS